MLDVASRHHSAQMEVREERDPQTFQRGRQSGDRHVGLRQADAVPLVQVTVRGAPGADAHGCGHERPQESAARGFGYPA